MASDTTAAQSEYYEAVRGSMASGEVEQAVQNLLEGQDQDREDDDLREVTATYLPSYEAQVTDWLSAQEEQTEREIDGQVAEGGGQDGYDPPAERDEEGPAWD